MLAASMVIFLQLSALGTMIDQIEIIVGEQILTSTDVWVEVRVALARRAGPQVANKKLTEKFLQQFREYIVSELIVFQYLQRLGGVVVSEEKMIQEEQRFKQRFVPRRSYEIFLNDHAITQAQVSEILQRSLANDHFIQTQFYVGGAHETQTKQQQHETAQTVKQWLRQVRTTVPVWIINAKGHLQKQ